MTDLNGSGSPEDETEVRHQNDEGTSSSDDGSDDNDVEGHVFVRHEERENESRRG